MLDPTKRRKYVFAALDYDLDGGGPETFIGRTARGLASGLWQNDCQMPAPIKSAEEIEGDVQAWLTQHPELPTSDGVVEIREDGSVVWDQDGMRRIERALSAGSGTMLADACAKLKRR
jgi:hypothetical protein